ncbi:MAG: transposase [Bacteroidales bacterium]|nr:transposase [Bacteroidales bacterium]
MNRIQKENTAFRALPKGIYHLCTDGWQEGKLFNDVSQFKMGMSTIALVADKYDAQILSFVLMPNHIHILLSATGQTCLNIFQFIRRRISYRLSRDGNAPLPDSYGMKLIPIEDRNSLRTHYIYLARNAYEKGFCNPGCYPWTSEYLVFSRLARSIRGTRIDCMNECEVRCILGSKHPLPGHWEIHPELGVLPRNYIDIEKADALFGSPKTYMTRLVKDYESFIYVSKELDEEILFSKPEVNDILYETLHRQYPGKRIGNLTSDEKSKLTVSLYRQYGFSSALLSEILYMPERTVLQLIGSKDYGHKIH